MTAAPTASTRTAGGELLALAARLFAEQGLRATTVRDIADAAGILSGSLYHHFDSKESMVDEILRDFLDDLFGSYRAILAPRAEPARTAGGRRAWPRSRRSTSSHDAVAIYQNEALRLAASRDSPTSASAGPSSARCGRTCCARGWPTGASATDLDIDLTYRFLRDTVWVGVRWYRPGGALDGRRVAAQYLSIVLDGIAIGRSYKSIATSGSVDGRGIHRRRGAHAGRAAQRRAVADASGRPRRARDQGAVRAQPVGRPGRRRRRDLRLRRHHRPAGRRHRPHRLAGRRVTATRYPA